MEQLRRLVIAAACAGTIAGVALFLLQHWTVVPLIERAESYEHAAGGHDEAGGDAWEPGAGLERTTYTAIGTVLTGIAFAAIALGAAVSVGQSLDARRGLVLGLIGFAAFVVAPGIGLPPKPPGVAGADVPAAQAWWTLAAVSTVLASIVLVRAARTPMAWAIAVVLLLLPHLLGAPAAPQGSALLPPELVDRFAWISMASRLPFWLLLGAVGGHLLEASDGPGRRRHA